MAQHETQATAHDNRVNRIAAMLDTSRPYVAIKPKGYINPIIGHYSSMTAARAAARRFNARIA